MTLVWGWWGCAGDNPVTWRCGILDVERNTLSEVKAIVTRQPDGSWRWLITDQPDKQGESPSRILAMEDVEKILL
jgi:hypothetical protein